MPTSALLQITQVSASQSQKEVTINNAFDALEQASNATLACDYAGAAADKVLSVTQFTRNFIFKCTNANAAAKLVVPQTVSALPTSRIYAVRNETGYPITVTTNAVGANTVLVPDLATRLIYTGGIHSIVAAEAASVNNFKDMLDVPNSYAGQAGKHVRVKLDETGLDFDLPNLADCSDIDFSVAPVNGSRLAYDTGTSKWKPVAYTAPTTTFLGLTDVPDSYAGHAAKFIRVNAGETGVEFVSTGVFSDSLTDLVDFPSAYTGAALKALRVNAAGTAVEFYTPTLVTAFANLTDVPASYVGQAGKIVRVKATEDGLEYLSTLLPESITDLPDFAGAFTGNELKSVRVNAAGTALEYYTSAGGITSFVGLDDVPSSYAGEAGKFVRVNATNDGLEFFSIGPLGATAFTGLSDAPASYTGQALKIVRVKADESGLEFVENTGGGGVGSGITSTRWRIQINAVQTGGAWASIKELEMRATAGGPDQCTGGAPSASSGTAANAFDDSTATFWQASGATLPQWIEYDFGTPVTVEQISIVAPGAAGDSPTNIDVQYWNGSTFVTYWNTTPTAWTASETRVLTNPTPLTGTYIDSLSDVDTSSTTPTNNEVLVFDGGQWKNKKRPYRVPWFYTSAPVSSEILLIHIFTTAVAFPANFSGSLGHCETPPAAGFAIDVVKVTAAGVSSSVGTITIANATGVVTFTSASGAAVNFAVGDRMKLVASATVGTSANVTGTFEGTY